MTAEERAASWWGVEKYAHPNTLDALKEAFEAHACEAVEAEREACERLEEACRDAMTIMQVITAHEYKAGSARYDYFDDEIAACEAALRKVDE